MFNNIIKANMASKEEIVELLKTTPEALEEFEQIYSIASLNEEQNSDNFFKKNSRMANAINKSGDEQLRSCGSDIVDRIVEELINYDDIEESVTLEEINSIPGHLRPQLSARYMKVDINAPSSAAVLQFYKRFLEERNPRRKQLYYNHFRQGLDILDLDPLLYEIIGMNKNSIGYWFPALENANKDKSFFKIPKTKIVKVPLPILQLTRCNYMELTESTIDIVNKWAYKAFDLDENKTYFIKTGTYSSKFDFRNAKVTTPQEVHELGSYLLFIHFQALQMASPLSQPSICGVSTTNEWCVREYIEDKENNPCIYHGMPLHTEYRVFVDLDSKEVLSVVPYWEPNVMKDRFSNYSDAESADMKHDWVIYSAYEEKLMDRLYQNEELIKEKVEELIQDLKLEGQWSLDIMQNGDDFWLIDMALAENSALNNTLPEGSLKKTEENWLPNIDYLLENNI